MVPLFAADKPATSRWAALFLLRCGREGKLDTTAVLPAPIEVRSKGMADRASDLNERNYGEGRANWTTGMATGRVGEGDNGSDERMRQDICDRLVQLGPVDCTEIGVTVVNGVVMLDGTVPTDDLKQRVFDVVSTIAGVETIESRLQVG